MTHEVNIFTFTKKEIFTSCMSHGLASSSALLIAILGLDKNYKREKNM